MYEPTLTEPSITPGYPPPPPRAPRRTRSLFWPGFAASFLLLSVLSCGGLAMTLGLNRLDLANLQNSGPVWTPQPATPTPEGAPPANNGSNPANSQGSGSFQPGQIVHNLTAVNIRQTPGYLGKLPTDVLSVARPGESLEIVEGPTAVDKLNWWHIRYQGVEGWVAEATASGVQILGK